MIKMASCRRRYALQFFVASFFVAWRVNGVGWVKFKPYWVGGFLCFSEFVNIDLRRRKKQVYCMKFFWQTIWIPKQFNYFLCALMWYVLVWQLQNGCIPLTCRAQWPQYRSMSSQDDNWTRQRKYNCRKIRTFCCCKREQTFAKKNLIHPSDSKAREKITNQDLEGFLS